jgi:Fe-S-cluster containining protein
MTKKEMLTDLRKKIPTFKCIPGCRDCCGPVPLSKTELQEIKGYKGRPQLGLSCAYECKKGCSIYEHRPIICRLFGTVTDPLIRCPHGFMPDTILSKAQADEIMEVYLKEIMT